MKPMKEEKICTYSFYIRRENEEVPFESMPEEEQKEFRKNFTRELMDAYMKAKGYQRIDA